jgi:trk system potassium uptake protein TrkH
MHKKKHAMNPARLVIASFLIILLVGAMLLTLPISSRDGQWTSPLTALFTATSATCVTGLVLVDTWLHWSPFGQVVILCMIQMGGLGFMTILTLFSLATRRRISFSQRMVMASTFNLKDLAGVVSLVRLALGGTFLVEGMGAVLLAVRFVPRFGWAGGLWRSVFTAVSAFCNAGFDLMGESGPFSSMTDYTTDPYLCAVLMLLILISGLGFYVWQDILQNRRWKKLCLYSRLVIAASGALVVVGTLFFALAEWHNPATLGNLTGGEKWLAALFQSVSLRTAGFNTVDQGALTESSKVVSCLLMVIGGGSGSTAGGVKVVTMVVLVCSLWSGLRGRSELVIRGRTIPHQKVVDAVNLVLMISLLAVFGSVFLAMVEGVPYLDALYEIASALGTVGLTTGITSGLCLASRLMLIAMMFLGRVGVLSVSVAFMSRSGQRSGIRYPSEWVMIG